MQKISFIVLFSLVFLQSSIGQSIVEIKSFADQLYIENSYEQAYKEYQRVFFFDKDNEFNDIHHKIATILYKKQDYSEAIKYYNLAWNAEKNDSIKNKLVFQKVLCNLKSNKFYAGLNELYDLPETNSIYFKQKQVLYEGICHYGLNDLDTAQELFSKIVDSIGNNKMSLVFTNLIKYNKKYDPKRIETMSRIIPGLGQIYIGDWKSGINSILLLGVIVYYSSVTILNYSLLDGILVLNSWFIRYYSGGVEKARNLAEEHIASKKSRTFTELLNIIQKHPFNKKKNK